MLATLTAFLTQYVVLPDRSALVVAAWVMAAWAADLWDRFPHLAVTSPEKRCGKTLLLRLLELICPGATHAPNVSPASLYRLIGLRRAAGQPFTLLLDEAQSLTRRGSESAEVLLELLCAGIDRKAKVLRVGGPKNDTVEEFPVYGPKVIACIGQPAGVLMDRCLPVPLRRKTEADIVKPFRNRLAEPDAEVLGARLEAWAVQHRDRLQAVYDTLEPFPIHNDRMAELLLSLMTVLTVAAPDRLPDLRAFADGLEQAERNAERQTPGVRLLVACREVYAGVKPTKADGRFLPTGNLIQALVRREEEPWATQTRGEPITPEALAGLLRPFGITSRRDRRQTCRGYAAADFADAWERYLPADSTSAGTPPKKPV